MTICEHEIVGSARAFATRMHQGQMDKQGRDYITFHLAPIAEAVRFLGPIAEAGAWLHDVLEDTPADVGDLWELGMPTPVVDIVVAVTRRDNETYSELIDRACATPLSACVKLADNIWNVISNPALAVTDPREAERLLHKRYLPARGDLIPASGLDDAQIEDMQMVIDAHLAGLIANV